MPTASNTPSSRSRSRARGRSGEAGRLPGEPLAEGAGRRAPKSPGPRACEGAASPRPGSTGRPTCKHTDEAVMTKISVELDGRPLEAEAGETIWQLAERHGTTIPHLCWHPAPDYRADGNCRACVVEIAGERVLAASCQRKVAAGMKVITQSERAKKARQMVFELLLADQPEREESH